MRASTAAVISGRRSPSIAKQRVRAQPVADLGGHIDKKQRPLLLRQVAHITDNHAVAANAELARQFLARGIAIDRRRHRLETGP